MPPPGLIAVCPTAKGPHHVSNGRKEHDKTSRAIGVEDGRGTAA